MNQASQFALDVYDKTFEVYRMRDRNLTKEKLLENIYRGKCGEIAAHKYLDRNDKCVSNVDFSIHEQRSHDADLEIIGCGIQVHIKTCKSNLLSRLFEANAPYVCNPTSLDYVLLVVQQSNSEYLVASIRHSASHIYKPTIKPMASKLAVYWADICG